MPSGLRRYHESGQSHFITFSCYRRQANFSSRETYDLFPKCLEQMRRRFDMCVYGYVVMPEHVHLLLSEPERGSLAEAIHYLKLSLSKRVKVLWNSNLQTRDVRPGHGEPFWQKRYYDRNVRNREEFSVKLRYLHRNPGPPTSAVFALVGVESGEARVGEGTGGLEVEQLSALCSPRSWCGGD